MGNVGTALGRTHGLNEAKQTRLRLQGARWSDWRRRGVRDNGGCGVGSSFQAVISPLDFPAATGQCSRMIAAKNSTKTDKTNFRKKNGNFTDYFNTWFIENSPYWLFSFIYLTVLASLLAGATRSKNTAKVGSAIWHCTDVVCPVWTERAWSVAIAAAYQDLSRRM